MQQQQMSIADVLADIEMRFLNNIPEEEAAQTERLFFQLEQAHWFYEDFYADNHVHLPHMHMRKFSQLLIEQSEMLHLSREQVKQLISAGENYQHSIPVCGCIIVNKSMNKLLLVRNWKGTSWTFPKGKINEGESEAACAIRECHEETGYNVGEVDEKDRFTRKNGAKTVTMYVAPNVDEDAHFAPLVRKEISKISWFPFDKLPKQAWDIQPFMGPLKKWASQQRKSAKKRAKKPRSPSTQKTSDSPQQKKLQRGHFGTEHHTTDVDTNNSTTFGSDGSWDVEDMFRVNSKITGEAYEYDGNPQQFGDVNFSKKQRERTNAFANKFANKATSFTAPPEIHVPAVHVPAVAAMFAAAQETQEEQQYAPSVAALFSAAATEQEVEQEVEEPRPKIDTVAAFFKAAAMEQNRLSPTSVDFQVDEPYVPPLTLSGQYSTQDGIPDNVAAFFSSAAAYEQPSYESYEQPQMTWSNGLLVPA
jgi:mRNA-decapping enzyme subunit 2